MELRVIGNITYLEALQLDKRYIPEDRLPNGVMQDKAVQVSSYLRNISKTFVEIEKGNVFRGRDNSHLRVNQKHHLALMFNRFGLVWTLALPS